jgi:VWFA-related protein
MRILCSFGIAATVVVGLAGASRQQTQQPPVFKSSADLLTIETSVLDKDGKPVKDLQPSDFTVEVGGKPRKVLFARFTGAEATTTSTRTTEEASTSPAAYATNTTPPGRMIVFVVDRDTIRAGYERALLEGAGAVLDALRPEDAVGLLALPTGSVEVSRDHARVRDAIAHITGTQPTAVKQFNISWTEALDFEKTTTKLVTNDGHTSIVIDGADTGDVKKVIERECPESKRGDAPLIERCPDDVRTAALEMLRMGRVQLQTTMSWLNKLAEQLTPMRGTKQIVMISGGMPFGQDLLTYFNEFAEKAAQARIATYAIHLDQPTLDASDRKTIASPFGGRDMATGLATLASMTGGAFFNGVGTAAGVFDRIRTEMNNSYEIGVEPLPEDADGKPRDLSIKVTRPGLTVRSRREVVYLTADARKAKASDPLAALLSQPTDVVDLPLAVSAYSTRGDEQKTLRVLISAEIGAGAGKAPVEWGFSVFDEDGNPVLNGRHTLEAATPGPWGATTSAKLAPGKYRLRLAAIDADARAGLIDVPLTVGLRAAGPLQASDAIVGVVAGGRVQPKSSMDRSSDLVAMVELVSPDPDTLDKAAAVLEIYPEGQSEPLRRILMANRPTSAAVLLAEAHIDTKTLAPGKYVASVIPLVDKNPVGKVSRRFEVK